MQKTWVWCLGQEDPGEGYGNSLQYSYLGNPMDRGAWQTTVHGLQRIRHEWATEHHQRYVVRLLSLLSLLHCNRKQMQCLPECGKTWSQESKVGYSQLSGLNPHRLLSEIRKLQEIMLPTALKLRPGCEREQPAARLGPPADDHIQYPPLLLTEEEGPLLSPTSQIHSQMNVTVKHVISRTLAERKSGICSSQASSTWP